MPTTISQRDLEVVRMQDGELIRKTWELVAEVEGKLADESRDYANDFYLLVGEMLERWAPKASWEEEKREVRESYYDNPEGYRNEIRDREESLRERREARARFQALFESELSVTDLHDTLLRGRLEGE
jgi:hypothetical protein